MSHQRSRARENVVKRRTPKVVTAPVSGGDEGKEEKRPHRQFYLLSSRPTPIIIVRPPVQVRATRPRFPPRIREKGSNFWAPVKKFKNFEQNIFDIRRFFGDFRETRELRPCQCVFRPSEVVRPWPGICPVGGICLVFRAHFFRGFSCGKWPVLTTSPRQCQQFVFEKCSTWSFLVGVASLSCLYVEKERTNIDLVLAEGATLTDPRS